MRRKVTLEEFVTTILLGIWQVICYIGKIFDPRYKTKFWRVVWALIAAGFFLLMLCVTINFFMHEFSDQDEYEYNMEWISSDVYVYSERYMEHSYVKNSRTGKKTIEGMDWFCMSPFGQDSLAVFAKNGRRGYFDTTTGEIVIPAVYSKAWIFSEGIAACLKTDTLHFINHTGKILFSFHYPFKQHRSGTDFCFHNGLCNMIGENGLWGLIDKNGNWIVKPDYSGITQCNNDSSLYLVRQGNNYGIVKSDGDFLYPCIYSNINFSEEDIFLTMKDNTIRRGKYDGTITDEEVYMNVYTLSYYDGYTGKNDEYGDSIKKEVETDLMCYVAGNYYKGLMRKDGVKVTKPIYKDIKALNKNLYICSYDNDGENNVLLDAKGNIVKQ